PLNNWGAIGVESIEVEEFGYAASFSLAQDIAERAELDQLQLVWQAATGSEMAYQPRHTTDEPVTGVPSSMQGWQRLLDLLEERTDAEYSDLWQKWVVNKIQLPLLATRQSARHQYAEVVEAAGAWELPQTIRSRMGAWEFDAVNIALSEAAAVLEDRQDIESLAAELDLAPPGVLREAFESNDGMAAATTEAAVEIETMEKLGDATDRLDVPGLLASIGLLGRDLQSELTAARAAFSDGDLTAAAQAATQVVDASDDAADAGRVRVAVGGASLLLLDGIGMGILFSRRRRGQRAPCQ
ncbi:MAG TPA: hypothetical protein VES36_00050, partial [Candidatus Limnocylindrales bacterium]|nr:hypothetical protein [Candidatus Limnocylindrales bacterium]